MISKKFNAKETYVLSLSPRLSFIFLILFVCTYTVYFTNVCKDAKQHEVIIVNAFDEFT